jgi:hypothetical protein
MPETESDDQPSTDYKRTSITLPVNLAEYAARRGNTSAYIAGLIAKDQRRERILQALADHGYVGDLAVTEEGLARARERLDRGVASRAARKRGGRLAA